MSSKIIVEKFTFNGVLPRIQNHRHYRHSFQSDSAAIDDLKKIMADAGVTITRVFWHWNRAITMVSDVGGVFILSAYSDSGRITELAKPDACVGEFTSENPVVQVWFAPTKIHSIVNKLKEMKRMQQNSAFMTINPEYILTSNDFGIEKSGIDDADAETIVGKFKAKIITKFKDAGATVVDIELVDFSRFKECKIQPSDPSTYGARVMTDDGSMYEYRNGSEIGFFGFLRLG